MSRGETRSGYSSQVSDLPLKSQRIRCFGEVQLARLRAALEGHAGGLEIGRRLEIVGGRFAQAQHTLAYVLHRAGDDEGARRACEEALRIDPNYVAARQLLAELNR